MESVQLRMTFIFFMTILMANVVDMLNNNCHEFPLKYSCLNSGSCKLVRKKYWRCRCPKTYTGARCETPSPCYPNPCPRSRSLDCYVVFHPLDFMCRCTPQYTGKTCETELAANEVVTPGRIISQSKNCHNTPDSYPCLNGGSCRSYNWAKSMRTLWRCHCPNKFTGKMCQALNPCSPTPCFPGRYTNCLANKIPNSDKYTFFCRCKKGYTGQRCESEFNEGPKSALKRKLDSDSNTAIASQDPCFSQPCLNDGTCIVNLDFSNAAGLCFKCHCTEVFTGPLCETPISIADWLQSQDITVDNHLLHCVLNAQYLMLPQNDPLQFKTLKSRKLLQAQRKKPKNPCMYGSKCVLVISNKGKLDYSCKCVAGTQGKDCSSGCPHGRYGPSCKKQCGWCKDRKCDSVDGTCNLPGCLPGYDSSSKTCTVQKGVAVSLTTTLSGQYDASLQQTKSSAYKKLRRSFENWVLDTCNVEMKSSSGCSFYDIMFHPGSVKADYTVLFDNLSKDINISHTLTTALKHNVGKFKSNGSYLVTRNSVQVTEITQVHGLQSTRHLQHLRIGAVVSVVLFGSLLVLCSVIYAIAIRFRRKSNKTHMYRQQA